jgi:predicted Zn-dependent protease
MWSANVRWARNLISSTGDDENNHVTIMRDVRGADNPELVINETTDTALVAALRQAERLLRFEPEAPNSDLLTHVPLPPVVEPDLFFPATYRLDVEQRAQIAQELIRLAAEARMLSAGYIEVMARSEGLLTSWGSVRYTRYTWARYTVTVRDPKGTGSGWAGVDHPDWSRIDGPALSAIALQKCLTSRSPARVEPGRYTTILEPQAVCDLVRPMVHSAFFTGNYFMEGALFNKQAGVDFWNLANPGMSKLGEKVVDERITVETNPMDPDAGFPPYRYFLYNGDPWSELQTDHYGPAVWIKDGVLTQLAYDRTEGIFAFGRSTGLPNSRAFRMSVSGPTTALEEMIASTKRGLLVTRFDQTSLLDPSSELYRGYTRDGLWLIENGKISRPVVNMVFTESPLFVLNNIEQLGTPQRTFNPPGTRGLAFTPQPVIVPPMKVRDFSFTALSDAI